MDREMGRTPCVKVCDAAEGGCLSGRIEEERWAERTYDVARCTARVYNHWIPTFQKVLADSLDEPDRDRRRMMLNSGLFTRTLWSMTYANISQGQCFECVRVCPVDARTRDLR
jgi:ferredoxin